MMIKDLTFRESYDYYLYDPRKGESVCHSSINSYRFFPASSDFSFSELLVGASLLLEDFKNPYGVVIHTDSRPIGVTKEGELYYVQ